jgi:hypothetical protein
VALSYIYFIFIYYLTKNASMVKNTIKYDKIFTK